MSSSDAMSLGGFQWFESGYHLGYHLLLIPYWMLASLFGAYPLFCIGRRLLRRALPSPRCPECGTEYDA